MSVDIKVAPDDKLQLVQTYFTDNSPSSDFFNITELPDTLSGGKNAFLIAGSDKLFPQSEVKVQVRDAAGNVCYVEYANGNPEYYEGISKVVAVYVYPNETAFGPATITILGQAIDVPDEWKFRFNVKWQTTININPSLPNTTRVRFYKRPKVDIVETLQPIYRIESGSKVESGVTASFANIKVSQLETFAGDVKRVKVFRTSAGDISDFDLIQDILIESKELLTTFDITSSVKGNAGIFTNETLKLWNTGSLTASLTNDRLDNGLRLRGRGIFRYNSRLSFVTKSTYELNLDAFYSSSTASNLGVYISGSNNGIQLIGTLEGTTPVKNLEDTYFTFDVDKNEPTASLYLSQSQDEWHVANVGLKLSEDSAFSPNQIDFITTMPTVIGNETYNFKFEFYDVNNNYVPVAVTQSALFTGGNNNVGGTLILISGSISSSNAGLLALSQSVSGTIGVVTGSVNTVSASVSSVSASLSSSISSSKGAAISSSFGNIQTLANGQFSGSFINDTTVFAPVIGGNNGYISNLFKVGTAPSIYLDARQNPRKIFIGGVSDVGSYNSTTTTVYMDSTGKFSLGNKLLWDGDNLTINGTINVLGGSAATDANALLYASRAVTSGSVSAAAAQTAAELFATSAAGRAVTSGSAAASAAQTAAIAQAKSDASASINLLANGNWTGGSGTFITSNSISSPIIAANGGYISEIFKVGLNGITLDGGNKKIFVGTGTYNNANTPFYFASGSSNVFSLGDKLRFDGANLTITGTINAGGGTFSGNITSTATISGGTISGGTITGGTINIGPNKFQVDSVGNIAIGGNVSLNAGGTVSIRGYKYYNGGVCTSPSFFLDPGGDFVFRDFDSAGTILGFIRGYTTITNCGVPGMETTNRTIVHAAFNGFSFYQMDGPLWATLNGAELNVAGDVVANTSDKRLKTNIINIDSPLEKLSKINGVYFNWNETAKELNQKDTNKREVGFIAQEVQEVMPEIVSLAPFDKIEHTNQSKSGENYLTIQYEKIVPLLVESIKELKKEIEELKKNK